MKKFVMSATVLAALAWAAPGWAEQVTLRIDNVGSDDDGWELTRCLARLPDVKVATRVTKDKPIAVIAFDRKCQLNLEHRARVRLVGMDSQGSPRRSVRRLSVNTRLFHAEDSELGKILPLAH